MVEHRKIYIHAAAALAPQGATRAAECRPLSADPDTDLRALTKQVIGQGLRQGSHFVELAAIGARLCLDRLGHVPTPALAIYLGTGLGDLRKTESLFRQALPPGPGLAAPFDFINASANMAAFYVARLVGVSARNLTLTQGVFSFEVALRLAWDDLSAGAVRAALVGGVDENCFPRSDYQRRWPLRDDEVMGEASAWLYLSTEPAGATAELLWVRRLATDQRTSPGWARTVAAAIAPPTDEAPTLICGAGLTAQEKAALSEQLPRAQWRTYIEYCGSFPTAAAFGVASNMEQASPGLWAHINRDADGETMLIGWRITSEQIQKC